MQTSFAPATIAGGAYQPVMFHTGIAYINGRLPRQHGELRWTGKVGSELDLEQARQAARLRATRYLLALEEALDGLRRAKRLLKMTDYVASAADFAQQPVMIDAINEYFGEMLDVRGGHVRATIGVAGLSRGAAVEVELIAVMQS